ncbi:MAG TPA: class I SAM-dependent methyltransferase [Actinomycetota bacterium]|nr:class I SAM-dependent methyltransferase [Actinomycetota bacterium]
MERYEASTYGDRIASIYDLLYPPGPDAGLAAGFVSSLAGTGPVLELGIGTGRIALPLSELGVEVHGIDASQAMVYQLRAKPGGQAIPVSIGDFTALPGGERYRLVFVAFNTFFALPDQEAQLRCLQSVAEHLGPGGAFVVEAFVPDLCRFDRGQRTATTLLAADWVVLESSVHDPVAQKVRSVHALVTATENRLYPVELRYAWPAELDVMARLAGLTLEQRWGGWDRSPFTATSEKHVSVYRLG